jgi:hypothetical protein
MIKEFVAILTSTDTPIDVAHLFDKKADHQRWEKMVKIFETIRIDNVIEGLAEVEAKFKLNKTEEITILAYVKFLELMIQASEKWETLKPSLREPREMMYG